MSDQFKNRNAAGQHSAPQPPGGHLIFPMPGDNSNLNPLVAANNGLAAAPPIVHLPNSIPRPQAFQSNATEQPNYTRPVQFNTTNNQHSWAGYPPPPAVAAAPNQGQFVTVQAIQQHSTMDSSMMCQPGVGVGQAMMAPPPQHMTGAPQFVDPTAAGLWTLGPPSLANPHQSAAYAPTAQPNVSHAQMPPAAPDAYVNQMHHTQTHNGWYATQQIQPTAPHPMPMGTQAAMPNQGMMAMNQPNGYPAQWMMPNQGGEVQANQIHNGFSSYPVQNVMMPMPTHEGTGPNQGMMVPYNPNGAYAPVPVAAQGMPDQGGMQVNQIHLGYNAHPQVMWLQNQVQYAQGVHNQVPPHAAPPANTNVPIQAAQANAAASAQVAMPHQGGEMHSASPMNQQVAQPSSNQTQRNVRTQGVSSTNQTSTHVAPSDNNKKMKPLPKRHAHTKNDHIWEKRFQQLLAYRQAHGDCDVPQKYRPRPELGEWVKNQRVALRKRYLLQERFDRLNDIGFSWSRQCDVGMKRRPKPSIKQLEGQLVRSD